MKNSNESNAGTASDHFIDQLADAIAARIIVPTTPAAPRLLGLAAAAEYIGRSRKAVEHLIARGIIPVTKLDGKIQVDRIALDKLIADRTYFEV